MTGRVWWAAVLVLAGCAVLPPSAHRYKDARSLEASYGQVWSTAIDLFTDNGWETERVDEEAGVIVSVWIDDTARGGDFGQSGPKSHIKPGSEQMAVNLRIVRESDRSTRVRVHCFFRARWAGDSEGMWGNGTSRGIWEARILEDLGKAAQ